MRRLGRAGIRGLQPVRRGRLKCARSCGMICANVECRPRLWLSPIRGYLYLIFQKCAKLDCLTPVRRGILFGMKTYSRHAPKDSFSVRCPICGSPPGKGCELSSGSHRNEPHRERTLAAKVHEYTESSSTFSLE